MSAKKAADTPAAAGAADTLQMHVSNMKLHSSLSAISKRFEKARSDWISMNLKTHLLTSRMASAPGQEHMQ